MSQFIQLIEKSNTIAISGHIRPDGDCAGSVMGLYHYLTKNYPEKKAFVFLEAIPESLHFLAFDGFTPGFESEIEAFDLFISLDCGDLRRLGEADEIFKNAKMTANIDHHISNTKFAKWNHVVPDASSTCEVLYTLLEKDKFSKRIAEAFYTGIAHDTGVFKHSNTSRLTMEIAGALLEMGIDFSKIIDESFFQRNYIETQILGRCLLESMLLFDGRCILSCISKKTMNFYHAEPEHLDGIIDQLRVTKGVEVAVFIYEKDAREYKVSMRANNDVDVSKIAVYFGGGGHVKAAGCTMNGSLHDVINNLTVLIEKQLI